MSPQPRKRTQPKTPRAKEPKPHAEDREAAAKPKAPDPPAPAAKPEAPDHPAPADAPPTDAKSRFPLQTGIPKAFSDDAGTSLPPEAGRLSSSPEPSTPASSFPPAGRIWT
jgi:hypothetical protein